jgi:cytidylate kinase
MSGKLELPATIALDGQAASGKSTIGRILAQRFGYRFLDTGLMYRAFALAAVRAGIEPTNEATEEFAKSLDLRVGPETEAHIYLGDEDVTLLLHDPEIERHVSAYARLAPVRDALREQQRAFALRGHAVLAGRDIGAVILPEAPLKFYLEADETARVRRRNAERGIAHEAHARQSHEALTRRDQLDSAQTLISPDAIVIDTTHLTLDEVIAAALEHIPCVAS